MENYSKSNSREEMIEILSVSKCYADSSIKCNGMTKVVLRLHLGI